MSHIDLAVNIFNATIPTAALFSKAVAKVVDYFLDDANQVARSEIAKIYQDNEKDASKVIMGYVREALRLRPLVSLSFSCLATNLVNVLYSSPVSIALQLPLSLLIMSSSRTGCLWILPKRMWVEFWIPQFYYLVNELKQESLGPTPDYFCPASEHGIVTPYEDGLLTRDFFEQVVPVIVGVILSHENLKPVKGESGKLTK